LKIKYKTPTITSKIPPRFPIKSKILKTFLL